MLRVFLCAAALLGLAAVSTATDAKDVKDVKNDNGMTATIVKMDAAKNSVTLKWTDKNGKEQQQSFDLTNDVKLSDDSGKSIRADAFKEGQQVRITENNGKLASLQAEKAGATTEPKNAQGNEATITNLDAKKRTVTVRMKDKDGKEVERTFALAEDARYLDSSGKVAALDVFRSGNDVLVIEEEGRLKQIQQKNSDKKDQNK